jgi:hypothetical protein
LREASGATHSVDNGNFQSNDAPSSSHERIHRDDPFGKADSGSAAKGTDGKGPANVDRPGRGQDGGIAPGFKRG